MPEAEGHQAGRLAENQLYTAPRSAPSAMRTPISRVR